MAYDGKILHRAIERFEEDKQRRNQQFLSRRARIFREVPRLEQIDLQLRSTVSQIIASALQRGTDPVPAIRVIRDENLSLQAERTRLLTEHGYPADALEEKPRCALCGDTGYREQGLCTCLRKYYAREQIEELSRMLDVGTQSFDTFELEWYSSQREGGYPRSAREVMERNLGICRNYAENFGPDSGNLLLFGDPGLGKTFLSACIARVVSEDGFSVVYDTAVQIFSQFENAKFHRETDSDPDGDVNRYLNCDLLILDDLGTEMVTAFVQSALYQLVNSRLQAGKSTIINTNLTPEEIGRRYSPQILSRLEGEYEILYCIGRDIRQLKKETERRMY